MAAREREADAAGSRASLARRISFWTTNLIATAFVLIVALVVGRELVRWWQPPGATAEPTPPLAAQPAGEVELQFGDAAHTMRRREHRGAAASALQTLEALCRTDLDEFDPQKANLPPVGSREQALLNRLSGQSPAAKTDGGGRLYRWEAGFPMVVGVMPVATIAPADAADKPRSHDGQAADRVVTWGLAIPYGDEAWRLLAFQPAEAGSLHHVADAASYGGSSEGLQGNKQTHAEAGSLYHEHVMSVRGADGTEMSVYRADDVAGAAFAEWKQQCDRQFATGSSQPWRRVGGSWLKHIDTPEANVSITLSRDDATGELQAVILRQPNATSERTTELKEEP